MNGRRIGLALAIVTALGSGAYVFIYLYRWEWHRAVMVGVIFIAAEIAVLGVALFDRLSKLGRRIDSIERDLAADKTLARIQESAPKKRRHFAWLSDFDGMGVFVPVLMGAGVLVSGIAWIVERAAQKTARPVLERRLAARLAPIALSEPGSAAVALPSPTRLLPVGIVGIVLSIAVAGGALVGLRAVTENRPDAIRAGTASVLELEVFSNDTDARSFSIAERLWEACSGTVGRGVEGLWIKALGGNEVTITLRPALGPYEERRLRGCLEDTTLEYIQATVHDVEHLGL